MSDEETLNQLKADLAKLKKKPASKLKKEKQDFPVGIDTPKKPPKK